MKCEFEMLDGPDAAYHEARWLRLETKSSGVLLAQAHDEPSMIISWAHVAPLRDMLSAALNTEHAIAALTSSEGGETER